MTIPFYKPPVLSPNTQDYISDQIRRILTEGKFSGKQLPHSKGFETELKEYLGVDYVYTCGSGSVAVMIALSVLHPDPTTVAMPAFIFESVFHAVKMLGHRPYFLDINEYDWNIEPGCIPRTANVIIPVHTFGNVIEEFPHDSGQSILFDASHAWGATIKDWGDVTIFSMSPTKNLTAMEGGVLATNDRVAAKRIEKIRDKMSRLSEVHALVGRQYLQYLDVFKDQKEEMVRIYSNIFRKYKKQAIGYNHSNNYFSILVPNPGLLCKKLKGQIEFRRFYNNPITIYGLPTTSYIAEHIIQLPLYPGVNAKEVGHLVLQALENGE
jgi:dTDP-4-amino-4,6-dideoxygalactose transaminase